MENVNNKILLVKIGGALLDDRERFQCISNDIIFLHQSGYRIVIVHGGGKEINHWLTRLEIPIVFEKGLRVTDEQTLEVVQMVLKGKVNMELLGALNRGGVKAIGLSGQDCGLLKVQKLQGCVGQISHVDTKILDHLISNDVIPVIASLGSDDDGKIYNINADLVAAEIVKSFPSARFICLTDVNGIYRNIHDSNSQIPVLKKKELESLLSSNHISDGMIPKLQACLMILDSGVDKMQIINGAMPNALKMAVYSNEAIGTTLIGNEC